MAVPTDISIAALNTKVLEVLAHMEADEWEAALKDLDMADALMVMMPDREFDDQRVEFRQKAEQLQNLRKSIEKRQQTSVAGSLTHIPVYRVLEDDC